MSNRSYDGDPVDLTYTHLSERDGQTVGGTTDDDKGEIKTDNWPEAAPPRDELKEDYIAVIEAVADPTQEWESIQEVQRQVVPHRANNYAGEVLRKYCPEGHKRVKTDDHGCERIDHSKQDVRDIRQRLINGESKRQIAEDYDCWQQIISNAAKGERGPDVDNPPALNYDPSSHGWHIDGGGDSQATLSDGADTSSGDHTPDAAGGSEVDDGDGEGVNTASDLSPPTASDGLSISEEYDTAESDTGPETNHRRQTVVYAVLAFLAGWLLGGGSE